MPIIDVNFNGVKPKFRRPEILTHPNIPKHLSGINPRSIMGQEWWDIHRRQVYGQNNDHCFACAVHSSEDPYHQWLEAHECYTYQWRTKVLKYKETVALCYRCHNFIHSGRLYNLWLDREVTRAMMEDILLHGLTILYEANLRPGSTAIYATRMIGGPPLDYVREHNIKASNKSVAHAVELLEPGWVLVFGGKKYNESGEVKDG